MKRHHPSNHFDPFPPGLTLQASRIARLDAHSIPGLEQSRYELAADIACRTCDQVRRRLVH
jgi:hypothetical protein